MKIEPKIYSFCEIRVQPAGVEPALIGLESCRATINTMAAK